MRDCNSAIVRVVDAARTNAISGVGDGEASGVSIGLAVGVGLTLLLRKCRSGSHQKSAKQTKDD